MVKLAGALFLVQSNDGGHHGEVLAESLVIVLNTRTPCPALAQGVCYNNKLNISLFPPETDSDGALLHCELEVCG